MGLFDSLYVDCPHCGTPVEFQSKEWNCDLSVYSLESAPTAILRDAMNWPTRCGKCDGWVALIDPDFPPGPPPRPALRAAKIRTPEKPETHSQGMKWWPYDKDFSYADLADAEANSVSGDR